MSKRITNPGRKSELYPWTNKGERREERRTGRRKERRKERSKERRKEGRKERKRKGGRKGCAVTLAGICSANVAA